MPAATSDMDVDDDGDKIDITHITKSQSNTNGEIAKKNEEVIQNKQEGKINENTKGTNSSGESKLGQQLIIKND